MNLNTEMRYDDNFYTNTNDWGQFVLIDNTITNKYIKPCKPTQYTWNDSFKLNTIDENEYDYNSDYNSDYDLEKIDDYNSCLTTNSLFTKFIVRGISYVTIATITVIVYLL